MTARRDVNMPPVVRCHTLTDTPDMRQWGGPAKLAMVATTRNMRPMLRHIVGSGDVPCSLLGAAGAVVTGARCFYPCTADTEDADPPQVGGDSRRAARRSAAAVRRDAGW